jgi:hypothetical protein
MTKHSSNDMARRDARAARHARLHSLLFAGFALGTTILALGAAVTPKLPPFLGE